MSNKQKTELIVSFEKEKLEKLYKAKTLFEQDSNHSVEMDAFLDMLVEAFLSYRNIRGATESQLLQKIAAKKADSPSNSEP
jgi:hypothetical protein